MQVQVRQKLALDLVLLAEGRTNSVLGELGNFFSPEFMNRFDGIIEFKALSKDNLLQIVELMLADVNKRLSSNNIHLMLN